jgi:hypothetical protein
MHKFGSNVIEKCLIYADKRQREDLISEIIAAKVTSDDSSGVYSVNNQNYTLMDLVKDKYGNYVI